MMIVLIVILLTFDISQGMNCGQGVPILTRTPNEDKTHTIQMQCYCPIDYYGILCRYHRSIHCYLSTKDVSPSIITLQNFKENMQLKVTISTQCYIQYASNKYVPIINYFIGKSMSENYITQGLQTGVKQVEIVWANDSSLFDEKGSVRYKQGYNFTMDEKGDKYLSKEDQFKIINGPGPYQFKYNSTFLGFPLTDSSFKIMPTVIMVMKNSIKLQNQQLSFVNSEEYANFTREAKSTFQDYFNKINFTNIDSINFEDIFQEAGQARNDLTDLSKITVIPLIEYNLDIKPRDQAQFGMIRAEVVISQIHSQKYFSKTSVNSAQIRVPIKIPGIGQATVYNKNFDPPTSRYIYFFLVIVLVIIAYIIYTCYKKMITNKLKKIQKAIEQDSELQEN